MHETDKDAFKDHATRLFETLTGRAPTQEQLRAWFGACQGLELNHFANAVDAMIADSDKRIHPVPKQLLAYAKQIASPPQPQNRPQKALSGRQNAQEYLVDITAMLREARSRGPLSPDEALRCARILASAPPEPKPAMSPCQFHGCTAPGTISPSTTGGGPWYCSEHFYG